MERYEFLIDTTNLKTSDLESFSDNILMFAKTCAKSSESMVTKESSLIETAYGVSVKLFKLEHTNEKNHDLQRVKFADWKGVEEADAELKNYIFSTETNFVCFMMIDEISVLAANSELAKVLYAKNARRVILDDGEYAVVNQYVLCQKLVKIPDSYAHLSICGFYPRKIIYTYDEKYEVKRLEDGRLYETTRGKVVHETKADYRPIISKLRRSKWDEVFNRCLVDFPAPATKTESEAEVEARRDRKTGVFDLFVSENLKKYTFEKKIGGGKIAAEIDEDQAWIDYLKTYKLPSSGSESFDKKAASNKGLYVTRDGGEVKFNEKRFNRRYEEHVAEEEYKNASRKEMKKSAPKSEHALLKEKVAKMSRK